MIEMPDLSSSLTTLFSELVDGAPKGGGAFILNSGDAGLLKSLHNVSAADASRSVNDVATIAAPSDRSIGAPADRRKGPSVRGEPAVRVGPVTTAAAARTPPGSRLFPRPHLRRRPPRRTAARRPRMSSASPARRRAAVPSTTR